MGLGGYSIELYIGEKRSGKTLTMIAETYEFLQLYPKTKVYANLHLNKKYFPTFQHIEKKDIEDFYEKKEEMKNCIFLIDEGHIFLDSRNFMQKGNLKMSYLFGQMGKRGNILKLTTHFPNLIDYRARLYAERYIYIQKGLLVDGINWKPILNNNRFLTDEENENLIIKGTPIIRKLINYEFQSIIDGIVWIEAKKYFKMYDTQELISPPIEKTP